MVKTLSYEEYLDLRHREITYLMRMIGEKEYQNDFDAFAKQIKCVAAKAKSDAISYANELSEMTRKILRFYWYFQGNQKNNTEYIEKLREFLILIRTFLDQITLRGPRI